MKKNIVIILMLSAIIFLFNSCRSEGDATVNNISAKEQLFSRVPPSNNSNSYYLVNEEFLCKGNNQHSLSGNSNINTPMYSGHPVYFWNFDNELEVCKSCKDLPSVIVNYLENYTYRPHVIPNKFIQSTASYSSETDQAYNAIPGSNEVTIDFLQDYFSGQPSSQWYYPFGQSLDSQKLNQILQTVISETENSHSEIVAVDIHYVAYLCENYVNGMRVSVKFR